MEEVVLNIDDYKNIKKYIKKYNYDENIKIGVKINNKVYYDEKAIKKENLYITTKEYWMSYIVGAINIKDKKEKYRYIFESMCDCLDENICTLCDFSCDKCIANRLKKSVHEKDGCCYFGKNGFCEYFKDKRCTKRSVSCKLFMCMYIEKKYKFKSVPKTYPLLNLFFNSKQKELLQRSYKKNFDEISEKLISM